ncbi:hypothetical protein KY336_00070 [Candidatus Woesearchaeota archaeon]|nr:hypothetical protein [Candidatus Woesearchaeota archaeon]
MRIQKRGMFIASILIVMFLFSAAVCSALSTTTTFNLQRGDSEFVKVNDKTYTFSLLYLNKDFAYFNLEGKRDSIDLKETKTYKLEEDYKTKITFLSSRRAYKGPMGRFSITREYLPDYGSGISHSIDYEAIPERLIDKLRTGEKAYYKAGPYRYKIEILRADNQHVALLVNREYDIAKKSEDKYYGKNNGLLRLRVSNVRIRNVGHEVTLELLNEKYQIQKQGSYIIDN